MTMTTKLLRYTQKFLSSTYGKFGYTAWDLITFLINCWWLAWLKATPRNKVNSNKGNKALHLLYKVLAIAVSEGKLNSRYA